MVHFIRRNRSSRFIWGNILMFWIATTMLKILYCSERENICVIVDRKVSSSFMYFAKNLWWDSFEFLIEWRSLPRVLERPLHLETNLINGNYNSDLDLFLRLEKHKKKSKCCKCENFFPNLGNAYLRFWTISWACVDMIWTLPKLFYCNILSIR